LRRNDQTEPDVALDYFVVRRQMSRQVGWVQKRPWRITTFR
jgi:hypothetical protein